MFGEAGNIITLRMKRNDKGRFSGMAWIKYNTVLEAARAISLFDKCTFYGRTLTVVMDKRKQRQEALEGVSNIDRDLDNQGNIVGKSIV